MKILTDIFAKFFGSKPIVTKISFDKSYLGTKEDVAMTFHVYNGFAYCEDFQGSEYVLTYPTIEFIKNCKIMLTAVKEFMGLKEEDDITISDVLQSYGSLFKIERPAIPDNQAYVLNTKETQPKIVETEEPKVIHIEKGDNPTEPSVAQPQDPDYYESDVYRP